MVSWGWAHLLKDSDQRWSPQACFADAVTVQHLPASAVAALVVMTMVLIWQ